MKIELEKLEVLHNEKENRFEIWIEENLSKLDYMLDGSTIVMTHVGVPPVFRGQGVAGCLTRAGLEYARENSLRVIPMCSYVRVYMRRHPEYLKLLEQEVAE